jgi:hypothetical protein
MHSHVDVSLFSRFFLDDRSMTDASSSAAPAAPAAAAAVPAASTASSLSSTMPLSKTLASTTPPPGTGSTSRRRTARVESSSWANELQRINQEKLLASFSWSSGVMPAGGAGGGSGSGSAAAADSLKRMEMAARRSYRDPRHNKQQEEYKSLSTLCSSPLSAACLPCSDSEGVGVWDRYNPVLQQFRDDSQEQSERAKEKHARDEALKRAMVCGMCDCACHYSPSISHAVCVCGVWACRRNQ